MIRMFIARRTNKDHPEWLAVSDLRVTTVNKNKDLFKEMDSILRVKKKMTSVMTLRHWTITATSVH